MQRSKTNEPETHVAFSRQTFSDAGSTPAPMAGAIYILPPERVHPVDVPFTVALKVFSKWGTGAGEFVRAMQAAKPSQVASSVA